MQNQLISYSAPAKVIFSGEHSVVYGEPALACALNFRLKITLKEAERPKKMPDFSIKSLSEIALKYFAENKIEHEIKYFTYKIDSQIPQNRGFGSSAALSVGFAACFWEFYTGLKPTENQINDLAFELEKNFHNNPSGMDVAVSTFGGLVFFRKEFDFLRNINHFNFSLPLQMQDKFYLIDSGKRQESTGELVQNVAEFMQENPALVKKLVRDIGKITKTMIIGIKENREKLILDTLVKNQKLLYKLGVVSEKADNLLRELEPFGLGKITGAGGKNAGSGFLLFYAEKPEKMEKYLLEHKIPYLKLEPSSEGVKRESIND